MKLKMCLEPFIGVRNTQRKMFRRLCRTFETTVQYHEPPDKSDCDKKLYRALSLSNGLRAMLISDSTNKIEHTPEVLHPLPTRIASSSESSNPSLEHFQGNLAACAVLVNVGSFSEPRQYQGMAHFLEHMIFMGSKKYPMENEFDAFITKSGGFSNAHTDNEETCFYFEVEEVHLDKAMDMFMNLIKAPLFLPDAIVRERFAVQSEFEEASMRDEVRRDQILASLASENYPHGTFSWGNLKSLKDQVDDKLLHEALHEFRRKHYGSNRMIVCIESQQSLDEIEDLLVRHCADIPNSEENAKNMDSLSYQKAFNDTFFGDVFLVYPVKDVCKLELTWVLPPMRNYYRCKPEAFFSQLIEYEGVGSLCSYLRQRLWSMSVMASTGGDSFESNSIYSMFKICIYLTDDGFEHIDEVLEVTFAWIKLLIESDEGREVMYKEFRQIAENSFRFQIQLPSMENVQNVVESIGYLPPKDVLTGSQLYFEYDADALRILKEHLSAFHVNIMISSHIPYLNQNYNQTEKWFGTQYTTIPIPLKWIAMWHDPPSFKELKFPQSNPFITTDFTLHWQKEGMLHIPRRPKVLKRNDLCELWFRQDDTFLLPDGYINIYFITPLVRESARNYMLGVLFTYLVEFNIAEQLYPALEAGLTYGLYMGDKGLILRVSGYNQKLPLLVESIMKVMCTITIDPAQVISFKALKKRQIFNALISGQILNHDLRLMVLENKRFSMLQKYESIDKLNVDDVRHFKDNFHKKMYIQALVQGNFTQKQASEVMQKVISTYNSQKLDNPSSLDNSLVQLPLGSYYLRAKNLNQEDTNTIVSNYYQIGPSELKLECMMDLVKLIVEEPFFKQLRTQEQLGYSLSMYQCVGYGVLAFVFAINTQETKHSADYVERRLEAFRSCIPDLVSQLSEIEFNDVRETLISSKRVGDTSLVEEVMRNWIEIVTTEYFFNRMEIEIRTLNGISKQNVLDFLLDYENNDFRKLSVQVVGQCNLPARSPTLSISDARQRSGTGFGIRPGSLAKLLDEVQRNISDEQLLFEQMGNNIKIELMGHVDDPTNIVDISAFKNTLNVYPLFIKNPKSARKS
ncbi:nardilysin [Drosophila guanche]|uniref:Blast:Nardilysin n=1 Tax=Drosophila guanche TaxID=7266 RepID=A0A3B0KHF7_DROGU|nr:nardilysin [Drosophila guanche]SPP85819.1 blast:Nardilysin [Drosophila guanche]